MGEISDVLNVYVHITVKVFFIIYSNVTIFKYTFFHSYLIIEYVVPTLREEPSQINVILQQKLPAAKLCAVCTVYKQ